MINVSTLSELEPRTLIYVKTDKRCALDLNIKRLRMSSQVYAGLRANITTKANKTTVRLCNEWTHAVEFE